VIINLSHGSYTFYGPRGGPGPSAPLKFTTVGIYIAVNLKTHSLREKTYGQSAAELPRASVSLF